jgi:di/tricarboxylate transporter
MTVGFPMVALLLPVMYGLLIWISRKEKIQTMESDILEQEIAKLGRISTPEKLVLGVFLFTSSMWILSDPLRGLLVKVPALKGLRGDQLDAFWALVAPVVLLSLRVLSPKGLKRMPWAGSCRAAS